MRGIAGFCKGNEFVALLPQKVQRPHDVARKERQKLAGSFGPYGNDDSYAHRYRSFINSQAVRSCLPPKNIRPPAIFSMSVSKLTTCRMLIS